MSKYDHQTRVLAAVDCIIFGFEGQQLKLIQSHAVLHFDCLTRSLALMELGMAESDISFL
jgi:hypothetical protein